MRFFCVVSAVLAMLAVGGCAANEAPLSHEEKARIVKRWIRNGQISLPPAWYRAVVLPPEQVNEQCRLLTGRKDLTHKGCALPCTIFVPPRTQETEKIWREEIAHCRYGRAIGE